MSVKKWLNLGLSVLWLIAAAVYLADGAGWVVTVVCAGAGLVFFLIYLFYARQESDQRDKEQDEKHERHI